MNSNEEKVSYVITIKTSSAYSDAGTSSPIMMEFIGRNNESTGIFELNNSFLRDKFRRGQKNEFLRVLKNVEFPDLIKIELKESWFGNSTWFCEYIEIGIQGVIEKVKYPIYDWVVHKMEGIVPGKATLPQNISNSFIKEARNQEITRSKELFKWIPESQVDGLFYGLPRFVNATTYSELPEILKRDEVRQDSFAKNRFEAHKKVVVNLIADLVHPQLSSLDDYKNLYKGTDLPMDDPHYIDDWKKDETMGRQTLTGISPLIVSKCKEIPPYFPVKTDDVQNLLEDGKTLQEEMEAGKIYICDYVPLVKDITRNKDLICPNCVGLFYAKDEKFLPIAIQLKEYNPEYLFTPNNSDISWMLAKMYFRCATASVHEWVYHFLYTHNVMEPFCVSLFRCLPKAHPIYKLLRPHLQTVAAINTNARTELIPPGSPPNKAIALSALETAKTFFKTFKFDDIVIPKRLKKQGTDDPTKLPGYYYRDDALKLWLIMEKFVKNIICYYYKSTQDVIDDYELQDWIWNIADEGLNWFCKEDNSRFPNKIASLDQLVEICVTVMFTCSAQHAAVNFGQFETYKFIPNAPLCMNKEPPKNSEILDESFVLECLPTRFQAVVSIVFTNALSGYIKEDVCIGQFPDNFFTEEEIIAIQKDYTKELQTFEEELVERNQKLGLKREYDYLVPGRVPIYIAI